MPKYADNSAYLLAYPRKVTLVLYKHRRVLFTIIHKFLLEPKVIELSNGKPNNEGSS